MVLNITRPLSVKLQGVENDIMTALESIDSCAKVLKSFREDEAHFSEIFSRLEEDLGDVAMPRLSGRQTNRANPPADTPEEYYKRAVFYPFVDTVLAQIEERFLRHKSNWEKWLLILPSKIVSTSVKFETIVESLKFYEKFLAGDLDEVKSDFLRWKQIWMDKSDETRPKTVIEALHACVSFGTYPNFEILLKIFATLPITTASSERSFSSLKLIKTYLRSTMTNDRLNGLALLNIHKDIKLSVADVISEFEKK